MFVIFCDFLERNKISVVYEDKTGGTYFMDKKEYPKVTMTSILIFAEGWCFLLQGDGSEGG